MRLGTLLIVTIPRAARETAHNNGVALRYKRLDGHGLNSVDHITNANGFVVSKRYGKVNAFGKIQWLEDKTAVGYFKVILGRCATFFCRRIIFLPKFFHTKKKNVKKLSSYFTTGSGEDCTTGQSVSR